MPRGNFIDSPTFNSTFFGLHLICLALFCAGEAIDALLAMKEKLTKQKKRHLDDARRDKQVKEHAVEQGAPSGTFLISPTQARLVPPSSSFKVILSCPP